MNAIRAKLFYGPLCFLSALLWMTASGCSSTPQSVAPSREESRNQVRENRTSDRYDLERDEHRGGHTLDRHVGRTDEELRERLERERNISAASTWTDLKTAEETVAAALRDERGRIESWMQRGERRPNLALHFNASHPVGRSLRRGENEAVPCTTAVIVLRAEGPDSFYVLTTYPEARE